MDKVFAGQYERTLPGIPPSEILHHIGKGNKIKVSGLSVNCSSKRLRTFKNSLICKGCGLVGAVFFLERHRRAKLKDTGWHLNLYAFVNGGHRLMTRDHITPSSKGGSDSLKNNQTMCTRCNARKGSQLPLRS